MNNYCIIKDNGIKRDIVIHSISLLKAQRVLLELFNASYRTDYNNWSEASPIGDKTLSFSTEFAIYTIKKIASPNE